MLWRYDYLTGQNIPVATTTETDAEAISQTLRDLGRSNLIVNEVNLRICYLPKDEKTPCLFLANLPDYTEHLKPSFLLINTIKPGPDSSLHSSWALYFNIPKQYTNADSFVEIPLSWIPRVEAALCDKTLISLNHEDKLHIQSLLSSHDKNESALALFKQGFHHLFQEHDLSEDERILFFEFILINYNQTSFPHIKARDFAQRKRKAGFHFSHSENTSITQNYRIITSPGSKPIIELTFEAHYDRCIAEANLGVTEGLTQEIEQEISEELSDFFIVQAYLYKTLEYFNDYTAQAKIRLALCTTHQDKEGLLDDYEALLSQQNGIIQLSKELNALIALARLSIFLGKNTQRRLELAAYHEQLIQNAKLGLCLMGNSKKWKTILTADSFYYKLTKLYQINPHKKALTQATGYCIDELKSVMQEVIIDTTSQDDPLIKVKQILDYKIKNLIELKHNLDLLHLDSAQFTSVKNRYTALLQEREDLKKQHESLPIAAIQEKTISLIDHHLRAALKPNIVNTTCKVDYTHSTTFHLTYTEEGIKPTLVEEKAEIFTKRLYVSGNVLDAFQEEVVNKKRQGLLEIETFDIPEFNRIISQYSHDELFKLITLSDLSVFSEEQQLSLLTSLIKKAPTKEPSLDTSLFDSNHDASSLSIFTLHLKNCSVLTTDLLEKILRTHKRFLQTIYLENCPGLDNNSIKLFSHSRIKLKKIILENLPSVDRIEIDQAGLTHLSIKNLPSLAYLKIWPRCYIRPENLEIEDCPALSVISFKTDNIKKPFREFYKATRKLDFSRADRYFESIKMFDDLNSLTLIYALGKWGLSDTTEHPDRVTHAIRLLLCVTNLYKKHTDPILKKLETVHPDVYARMNSRIINISQTSLDPNAFFELLSSANTQSNSAMMFDFRDVAISSYQHQIKTIIDYLNLFVADDESSDSVSVFDTLLSRCETYIPSKEFFYEKTRTTNEGLSPFCLLVTPSQKLAIERYCTKLGSCVSEAGTPEMTSPILSPSASHGALSVMGENEDDDDCASHGSSNDGHPTSNLDDLEHSGSSGGSSDSPMTPGPSSTVVLSHSVMMPYSRGSAELTLPIPSTSPHSLGQ